MSFWVHVLVVIVLTAYFIFRFIKDRQVYEALFLIWIPSTLLQYVFKSDIMIKGLGIFQIIMFILVIYFLFKRRKQNIKKTAKILADYATGDLDKVMKDRGENDTPSENTNNE